MKTMKKIVYIMVCAFLLVSCEWKEPVGWDSVIYCYLNGYFEAERMGAKAVGWYDNLIHLTFEGKEYSYMSDENTPNGRKFRELSDRYGDTDCWERIFVGSPIALCNEFTRMDVVSDRPFNDIPAGSSLGGVVKLLTSSAKPFLDSGYKDRFNWWSEDIPAEYGKDIVYNLHNGDPGFHPVSGLLSELDPETLMLFAVSEVWMLFTEEPEEKEHTFTITLQDRAGRTLSCTIAYTF